MNTDQKDIIARVEASLDSVRPYLRADGGDMEIVGLTEEMVLQVRLLGACETCPQSIMTMKAGIEDTVRKAVPEIQSVVAVEVK